MNRMDTVMNRMDIVMNRMDIVMDTTMVNIGFIKDFGLKFVLFEVAVLRKRKKFPRLLFLLRHDPVVVDACHDIVFFSCRAHCGPNIQIDCIDGRFIPHAFRCTRSHHWTFYYNCNFCSQLNKQKKMKIK